MINEQDFNKRHKKDKDPGGKDSYLHPDIFLFNALWIADE